jgi:DNA polymerase IV (DinB-like DNA polymerase)
MGIETVGDLAATDRSTLTDRFGERGRELHARARGTDDRDVTPTGLPKSLSRESAFADPTADVEPAREKLRTLAADVADRARSRGALYGTIGIKVVTPPFDVHTRARSLSGPVDDPALVQEIAEDLLTEFEDEVIRKLGVRVSSLEFAAADQATLGGFESVARSDDTTDSEPPDGTSVRDRPEGHANGQSSITEFE